MNRPLNLPRGLSLAGLAALLASAAAEARAPLDLPLCEAASPGQPQGLALGLVQPGASEHVLDFMARVSVLNPGVEVCQEAWGSVLPQWVPWGGVFVSWHSYAIFALAFAAAVTVLWRCTPRRWWRRTTLLGVLGVAVVGWTAGLVLMNGFHAVGGKHWVYGQVVSLRLPQQAQPQWHRVAGARDLEALLARHGVNTLAPAPAAPTANAVAPGASPASSLSSGAVLSASAPLSPTAPARTVSPLTPEQPTAAPPAGDYRVIHRLNLREAAGIQSAWLATLPRGAVVAFDGAHQGDWWRIRTADGRTGWASSLWLRRPQELGVPPVGSLPGTRG